MSELADDLRREADRLIFKIHCLSMRGNGLTMAEAIQFCEQREKELRELERRVDPPGGGNR